MSNRLMNINLHNFFIYLSLFLVLILSSGCSTDDATKQLTAEERFRNGMALYNNEDYLEAIEEFKIVSLQYQGSKVADSSQFYMAQCRFMREEYILAAFEYDILIRNMPYSPFVSRSRFGRATCYYNLSPESYLDQEYSKKAIEEYQTFIEYHPNDTLASTAGKRILELNTKLAKKDYESGIIYMHMEYYKSATYYFDLILDKYHDTEYAEPALFKKIEALMARKKFSDAKEAIEKYLAKYSSGEYRKDVEKLYAGIENKILEEKADKQKKAEMLKEVNKQLQESGS